VACPRLYLAGWALTAFPKPSNYKVPESFIILTAAQIFTVSSNESTTFYVEVQRTIHCTAATLFSAITDTWIFNIITKFILKISIFKN